MLLLVLLLTSCATTRPPRVYVAHLVDMRRVCHLPRGYPKKHPHLPVGRE